MATYNKTNYYSTLGDTVYYTDLGQIFHDLSYGNVVNGVKTFSSPLIYTGNAISYSEPILQSQMANKKYVDSLTNSDPFFNSNYVSFTKSTMPNTNQITSLFFNITANLPTTTYITQGNILAVMDTPPNNDQIYTFGASKPGLWIAGGQSGVGLFNMAYSYDGIQWFGLPSSPFTTLCNAVAWNGSIWVAMGQGTNSLAYSYDGFTWTGLGTSLFQISTSVSGAVPPYGGFAWNNYIWVAVCTSSPTNVGNYFLYSYDGINWIPNAQGGLPITTTFCNFVNVYWNGSLFLACGNSQTNVYNMAYSYNGIQWYYVTSVTGSASINAAAWNGTQWCTSAAGGNYLMNSSDGVKWVQNTATFYSPIAWNTTTPTQIIYNGQIWLATGQTNAGYNTHLWYSWDGWNWTNVSTTGLNATLFPWGINNLAWNGFMWIACGKGTVSSAAAYSLGYSYNGLNWFGCYNPQTGYNSQNVLTVNCFCACWGGRKENILYFPQNRTLVLGSSNTIGNTIAYSFDGSGGWIPSTYNTSTPLNFYAKNRSPFLFSSANGASWNGYMWVVGGTTNTLPYYTTGNTMPASLNFTSNITGSNVSYFSSTSSVLFYNIAPAAYTIEAWIRIPTTGNQNTGTMGIAGIFNSGIGLATIANGGINYCLTSPGASVTDTMPLNDNSWHYVAVTVVGGVANASWYYIDGVQRPIPFTVNITAQSNPFCIGTINTSGTGNQNFIGHISEVRVWNVALTAKQIAVQWNSNVLPTTTGLSGYYSYNRNLPTTGTISTGSLLANLNTANNTVTLTTTINTNTISFDTTIKPTAPSTNFYEYTSTAYYPPHTLAYSHILNGNTVLGNAGNSFVGMNNYTFDVAVNNIQWNGNLWVAVGQGGNTIGYSPDGFTWTGLSSSIFYSWGNSLAWNGAYWVAVGRGANTIAYSTDGIQWRGLSNSIFTNSGNGVAWNGTYWIAVGQGGNTMAISTDGQTWTGMGSFTFSLQGNDIASNNTGTMWLAGGAGGNSLAWSLDGMLWNRSQTANSIFTPQSQASNYVGYCNSVTWNGRWWIATGYGNPSGQGQLMNTMAHSFDGNIFTTQTNTTIFTSANRTVWNGNQGVGTPIIKQNFTTTMGNAIVTWASGGASGTSGIGNTLAYSYNGLQWTGLGTTIFNTNCSGTSFNGGVWVACGTGVSGGGPGGNTLAYSANGNNWTGLGSSIFNNFASNVDWNGYIWVSGGNSGGVSTGNTMAYSYDGINWVGLGAGVFNTTCNYIAWQGTYWLATGQSAAGIGNTLAYSYNGIQWFGLGKFTFDVAATAAVWNGFMWVATGNSGGSTVTPIGNTLAYSYNGINWTGMGSFTFTTLSNYISWNGLMWIAVGQGGNSIAYSYSGNTWTAAPNNGNVFSYSGNVLSWNGNTWTAFGTCNQTGFGNTIAYSFNGINWTGLGNTTFSNSGQAVSNNNVFGHGNQNNNKLQISTLNQPQLPYRSLDIVGDNYYQSGYNGVTISIKSTGTGYPAVYSGY